MNILRDYVVYPSYWAANMTMYAVVGITMLVYLNAEAAYHRRLRKGKESR